MSTITPTSQNMTVRTADTSRHSIPGSLEGAKRVAGIAGDGNPAVTSRHPITDAHIDAQVAFS